VDGNFVQIEDNKIVETLRATTHISGMRTHISRTAFSSPKQLFLTTGHELLHAGFNRANFFDKPSHYRSIREWELRHARRLDFNLSRYEKAFVEVIRVRPTLPSQYDWRNFGLPK